MLVDIVVLKNSSFHLLLEVLQEFEVGQGAFKSVLDHPLNKQVTHLPVLPEKIRFNKNVLVGLKTIKDRIQPETHMSHFEFGGRFPRTRNAF